MSGDFLDSNILLYLFSDDSPSKRQTATRIFQAASGGSGTISFQVVQEVLSSLIRRSTPPVGPEDARRYLEELLVPLWRVMPSAALYQHAIEIQARYRHAFYDSLIIAAALEAGCDRLLTEDLHDGQRIEGLTIRNPFAERT